MQHIVTLSTNDAEYVALLELVKHALRLKGFIYELGGILAKLVISCHNKNQAYYGITKFIYVKLHFIRDVEKSKEITI